MSETGRPQLNSECSSNGPSAALLLVESLLHMLIERRIFTLDDALEVVSTAIEVSAEPDCAAAICAGGGGPSELLERIRSSLMVDSLPL